MLEKAEQGLWPNRAPLGYLNVEGPDGKKIVVPNPDTSEIVTRMFERYATGNFALEEIGQMAIEEGLPLKREGNLRSVVQYSFKNPFYYGDFKWKGKMYRGVHVPLITRQLWNRVQEVRHSRRRTKTRRSRRNFAFSRLISCGHCGCALVGELKKEKYVYYHCTYYRGKCPEPYVREEVLEEKFTEILRSLHFDSEVLGWLRQALRESQVDEKRFREESIARLQKEYTKIQKRIDAMCRVNASVELVEVHGVDPLLDLRVLGLKSCDRVLSKPLLVHLALPQCLSEPPEYLGIKMQASQDVGELLLQDFLADVGFWALPVVMRAVVVHVLLLFQLSDQGTAAVAARNQT